MGIRASSRERAPYPLTLRPTEMPLAKRNNPDGAVAPRARPGLPRAVAASTVRSVPELPDINVYLEALDAQRSLFVSQLSLVQTQALQLQNMVVLYRALGGGWREASEVQAVSNPEIPPPR